MLLAAIKKLYNVGIIVRSLTCDGSSTNYSTFRKLGCNFNIDNLKTHFKHPWNDSEIVVILDPCHMIKLCRTGLATVEISTPTGRTSFRFITALNDIQEKEGFKFANRLSAAHIDYQNKKIKVALATQTISSGVADAIDYLRAGGNEKFKNSEATTEFLRIFDRLFDMLDSRNAYGKEYKSPLSLNNFSYWNEVFSDTEKYIRELTVTGRALLQHDKKCFALGFLIDIQSFRKLALDLLKNIKTPLKYFLTHKCSQDHIELYFCCLRSRGGWNNNPSVMQLLWAVRRLLYKNSIKPSINANCLTEGFESSSILEFWSSKRALCDNEDLENNYETETLVESLDSFQLPPYQSNILYYITGNIVKKLKNKCNCTHCNDILLKSNNKTDHEYTVNPSNSSGFLTFVNRGGLCVPSEIAFKIVMFCEKVFQIEIKVGFIGSINFKDTINAAGVKHFLPMIPTLFKLTHPLIETVNQCQELHEIKIIKLIAESYCTKRLHTYAKTKTLEYLGKKATMRHKLHKTILFYHV